MFCITYLIVPPPLNLSVILRANETKPAKSFAVNVLPVPRGCNSVVSSISPDNKPYKPIETVPKAGILYVKDI